MSVPSSTETNDRVPAVSQERGSTSLREGAKKVGLALLILGAGTGVFFLAKHFHASLLVSGVSAGGTVLILPLLGAGGLYVVRRMTKKEPEPQTDTPSRPQYSFEHWGKD